MPVRPKDVWASLPDALRQQVTPNIIAIFREVIRERTRPSP